MTLLAPVLLAAILVVPIFLTTVSDQTNTIQVLDESGLFQNKFESTEKRKYIPVQGDLETLKTAFLDSDHTALLYIPHLDLANPTGIRLYSQTNVSLDNKIAIENKLRQEIEAVKYRQSGIDQAVLEKIKTDISINTTNLSKEGEKDNNAFVTTGAGYAGAFLIYMFIFIYGVQIMRGVIEEKTSRIVEVIISSVKPFQLMMGKILGIAAVGLTQFLLWIILSTVVTSAVTASFKDKLTPPPTATVMGAATPADVRGTGATEILTALDNLNLPLILGCFVFYFLGGYLLYGALFGAVGAAVDNETDTQQFMLPITVPLIMTFIVAQTVIIRNPDGAVAFWMSIIPFTSPIAMMLRIPFGVPLPELLLSMGLLVLGFMGTTWLAARIYRVGILMYGKKVNYRELSKWIFYKV
ncbi:MAG: transporter permease [Adhaeribacter sp.]|nr:transporter permease [Adhaeribacter sp.]